MEENEADIARLDAIHRWKDGPRGSPGPVLFLFSGKKWLELPILDAFGSPLKIDNLWTENLTWPMAASVRVRRFDRCTTCHKGIDKTAPGSATEPAYPPENKSESCWQLPITPAGRLGEGSRCLRSTKSTASRSAEVWIVVHDDVTSVSIIEPRKPRRQSDRTCGTPTAIG